MPSSQKTPNLGLNKWQPGDQNMQVADFVQDNEILDTEVMPKRIYDPQGIGKDIYKEFSNDNLLINEAFQMWQRGTSFTAVGYTADRWRSYDSGVTVTQEVNTSQVPTPYSIKCVRTSTNGSVTLHQMLENRTVYNGKSMNGLVVIRGVGGFTGALNLLIGNKTELLMNLTSEWQEIAFSDLAADFSNGTPVFLQGFAVRTVSNNQPNAGQGFEVAFAGLAQGVIRPYPRLYGEELALCQRYYESVDVFYCYTYSNYLDASVMYSTTKRIGGTVSIVSMNGTVGCASYYNGASWVDFTVATNVYISHVRVYAPSDGLTDRTVGFKVICDAEIY